ncbi:amidohydrolase family protein [Actinomadura sp. 3N508]|uniref:amidohydrolase family protein n=1 Tax=Actinomadura sp. 3N508 TaxID=3375153 RepID=UPI003787C3B1
MTVVDTHAHALPSWVQAAFLDWLDESGSTAEGPPGLWRSPAFDEPDRHVADAHRHGIDITVLTHSSNAVAALHSAAVRGARRRGAADTIAAVNDEMRTWATRTGGRLQAARWVDPRLAGSAEREIERAATDGGIPAISMNTAYADPSTGELRFLDDPAFEPVLAAAEASDVVVFVHPSAKFRLKVEPALPGPAEHLLTGTLSMLVESTVCISRLVLRGTLERHSALRTVFGQLGGVLPLALGRFDLIHQLIADSDGTAVRAFGALRHLRDYVGNVYADTHSADAAGLECALAELGEERVLFGSDFPVTPGVLGRAGALETLRKASLPAATLRAVESGNARSLLGLAGDLTGHDSPAYDNSPAYDEGPAA